MPGKILWNQYYLAKSLSDALRLSEQSGPNARWIAGGTDIILAISEGRLPPVDRLIDISTIPELSQILKARDFMEIGACVTLTQLLQSDEVRKHANLLIEAARTIAGNQIRNQATIGGNVVNASPAADMIPALLVLDSSVLISGFQGDCRAIPLELFLLGNRKVNLRAGELVTAFHFSIPPKGSKSLFRKVQPRRAMAIATLNLAILAYESDGIIQEIRLAMGSVAPTAVRLKHLEQKLVGQPVEIVRQKKLYTVVEEDITPISDFRASRNYRLQVAQNLLAEQLCQIFDLPENVQ